MPIEDFQFDDENESVELGDGAPSLPPSGVSGPDGSYGSMSVPVFLFGVCR